MEGRGEGSNDCRACARGVESSFSSRERVVSKRLFSSGAQKRARLFVSKSNRFSSESRLSIFLDIFFLLFFFDQLISRFFCRTSWGKTTTTTTRDDDVNDSLLSTHTRNNASRNKTLLLVRRLLAVFFVSLFFFSFESHEIRGGN